MYYASPWLLPGFALQASHKANLPPRPSAIQVCWLQHICRLSRLGAATGVVLGRLDDDNGGNAKTLRRSQESVSLELLGYLPGQLHTPTNTSNTTRRMRASQGPGGEQRRVPLLRAGGQTWHGRLVLLGLRWSARVCALQLS